MNTKWTQTVTRDDYRRTLIIAHLCWWSTALIIILRAFDTLPQQLGSFALLTLGIAVAASLALSRMRLAETITSVFHVGLQSAVALSANVFTDTCIMVLDGDGKIEAVDHADAIGWDSDEIKGRELRALLAPRSYGSRSLKAGISITNPMQNQKGELFDARFSFAALNGEDPKSTHMIATVSPVIAINAEGNYRK